MPKDRTAADLDQRFRPDLGFFGETAAEASGQYDHLSDIQGSLPPSNQNRIAALAANKQYALHHRAFTGRERSDEAAQTVGSLMAGDNLDLHQQAPVVSRVRPAVRRGAHSQGSRGTAWRASA
jgi:hypothetical protein